MAEADSAVNPMPRVVAVRLRQEPILGRRVR